MRHHRCYHPEAIHLSQQLTLTPEASHHLATVLRCRVGQVLEVFDGQQAFTAHIIDIGKRAVQVHIDSVCDKHVESPLYVHLAQAIAKADKIDWVIQKAVELGVNEITLLLTERCDVRAPADGWHKKMQHWHSIIIHAVQQSGRIQVPRLHAPMNLPSFLTSRVAHDTGLKCILHPAAAKQSVADPFDRATIIVGPEGGFSDKEISLAQQAGCQSLVLGPRVLRTETAPLAMISVLQYLHGDFEVV